MKIVSCIMLILFATTLGGCKDIGKALFKSAGKAVVKSAGNAVGKTVVNAAVGVPKAVVKEARDQAVETAFDAVTGKNQPTNNNRTTNSTTPARTSPKPAKLAGAGMVMVGGAMIDEELMNEVKHWIKDTAHGAYVWNPEPQDGESVRWDGGTVRDGNNLYAQGNGRLNWFKNGQFVQVDEGTFEHGKQHGEFKHTRSNGEKFLTNWNHGEEIPLSAPTKSAEDKARQAFLDYHQAITEKNYVQAYATLMPGQKERVGDFKSYSAGYANTLSSEVSKLSTVSASDNSVTFNYELTARDRVQGNKVKVQKFNGQATLINVGGNWFIQNAKSAKVDEYIER